MADRPWMTQPDPERIAAAIDYALAFFWKEEGPMPEPDVELAENALSLIAGMYTARFGDLRSTLLRSRQWLIDHPGEWPDIN